MTEPIIVAGGGIGGLEAALRLDRGQDRPVTVVSPRRHTLFYPGLHRVLEDRPFDSVCIDLDERFRGRDIRLVQDRLTGIDPDTRTVSLAAGEDLRYDAAVLALGSETAFHGVDPSTTTHTLRFKEDMDTINDRIAAGDIRDVVVVGGGATGVEAAASLQGALHGRDASITLIEAADRLLPRHPERVGRLVERDYRSRGMDLLLERRVASVEDDMVTLADSLAVDSDLTVWAGGVQPNPVVAELPLPRTQDGLRVDRTMRVHGTDAVYAIGDNATYDGKENRAFYALAEAKVAAKNIIRRQDGSEPVRHQMRWSPSLIYLGRRDGLLVAWDRMWRGSIPALMRSWGVEKRYMLLRKHWL